MLDCHLVQDITWGTDYFEAMTPEHEQARKGYQTTIEKICKEKGVEYFEVVSSKPEVLNRASQFNTNYKGYLYRQLPVKDVDGLPLISFAIIDHAEVFLTFPRQKPADTDKVMCKFVHPDLAALFDSYFWFLWNQSS